ncbi:hypothetical protein, partial [Plasmodium yoelii yoelii]
MLQYYFTLIAYINMVYAHIKGVHKKYMQTYAVIHGFYIMYFFVVCEINTLEIYHSNLLCTLLLLYMNMENYELKY